MVETDFGQYTSRMRQVNVQKNVVRRVSQGVVTLKSQILVGWHHRVVFWLSKLHVLLSRQRGEADAQALFAAGRANEPTRAGETWWPRHTIWAVHGLAPQPQFHETTPEGARKGEIWAGEGKKSDILGGPGKGGPGARKSKGKKGPGGNGVRGRRGSGGDEGPGKKGPKLNDEKFWDATVLDETVLG